MGAWQVASSRAWGKASIARFLPLQMTNGDAPRGCHQGPLWVGWHGCSTKRVSEVSLAEPQWMSQGWSLV